MDPVGGRPRFRAAGMEVLPRDLEQLIAFLRAPHPNVPTSESERPLPAVAHSMAYVKALLQRFAALLGMRGKKEHLRIASVLIKMPSVNLPPGA